MDEKALLEKITKIRMFKSKGERALHKPLLILCAIAQIHQGNRFALFSDFEPQILALLEGFGPLNKSENKATFPFTRLANDGIWVFDKPDLLQETKKKDYQSAFLRANSIAGGFTQEIYDLLKCNITNAKRATLNLEQKY